MQTQQTQQEIREAIGIMIEPVARMLLNRETSGAELEVEDYQFAIDAVVQMFPGHDAYGITDEHISDMIVAAMEDPDAFAAAL